MSNYYLKGKNTPAMGALNVAAMPAATILEFDASGRRERRYWDLTWRKRDFSLGEGAELLADAMRGAVARQTRGSRVGLLLSGGLDSRAVLAAAEQGRMGSWTTASYDANPELALARDVAAELGSEHHALIVEPKDTLAVLDRTVIESSGLYPASTPMSAFLPKVGERCDAILSGHGLDYTLRGYYLPSRFAEIAGSTIDYPHPVPNPAERQSSAFSPTSMLPSSPSRRTPSIGSSPLDTARSSNFLPSAVEASSACSEPLRPPQEQAI